MDPHSPFTVELAAFGDFKQEARNMEERCKRYDYTGAECTCEEIQLYVYEDQFGCETPPADMKEFTEIIEDLLNQDPHTTYSVEAVQNSNAVTMGTDAHQDFLTDDAWIRPSKPISRSMPSRVTETLPPLRRGFYFFYETKKYEKIASTACASSTIRVRVINISKLPLSH